MISSIYRTLDSLDRGIETPLRAADRVELVERIVDGKRIIIEVSGSGQVRYGARQYAPYGERAITYCAGGGWGSKRSAAQAWRRIVAARGDE